MKDNLLYKRCSKLEKENQELKDTLQDKIECIIAYDEIIKQRDKEIIRLSKEIDIWNKKYNEVFDELKEVRNNEI